MLRAISDNVGMVFPRPARIVFERGCMEQLRKSDVTHHEFNAGKLGKLTLDWTLSSEDLDPTEPQRGKWGCWVATWTRTNTQTVTVPARGDL